MSKTVLSVERQAEPSTFQSALEASLLRVKEEKRSEEEKIFPCDWVTGASPEFVCTSFSHQKIMICQHASVCWAANPALSTADKQQSNLPLSHPAKIPKGVPLIGRAMGEGLCSPGDQALLFRWGWVCLSLSLPVLQPHCERDVWMGHRQ